MHKIWPGPLRRDPAQVTGGGPPLCTGTVNSQRRVAMHTAPRAVSRPFLLGLERDEAAQRACGMRKKGHGRDQPARATPVAEAPAHTHNPAE